MANGSLMDAVHHAITKRKQPQKNAILIAMIDTVTVMSLLKMSSNARVKILQKVAVELAMNLRMQAVIDQVMRLAALTMMVSAGAMFNTMTATLKC